MVYRTFAQIGSSPQGNAFKSGVDKLRQMAEAKLPELAPWEADTLSLICSQPLDEKSEGLFVKSLTHGYLSTIYQEKVAAYAKTQIGQSFLLYVQTKDDAYLFQKQKHQTEIWINSERYGVFAEGALISADNRGKLLGKLEQGSGEKEKLLYIGNKAVGTLVLNHSSDEVNPRAVHAMEQIPATDAQVVKAFVFYYTLGENK